MYFSREKTIKEKRGQKSEIQVARVQDQLFTMRTRVWNKSILGFNLSIFS